MTLKDWKEAPVFGERAPNVRYTLRPGAYAFLRRAHDELALVRTPQGVFLPGGGIEADETPEAALVREVMEECGFVVRAGAWAAHAVQFVYSTVEGKHFEKRCIFMQAEIVSSAGTPTERDHELVWVSREEACKILAHESQRWAVATWASRD